MKAIVFNIESGEINQSLDFNNLDEIQHLKTAFEDVIPVEGAWENHYVSGGVLLEFPAKPSPHHEWDWTTKSWIPDLPAAISARKAEINVERDRRISLPLLYDGKNLDADARARENLKSKLEEIKSREALNQPMPQQMMVWRDADNITHSWPTQEAYKAWLEGFVVSMSERGTMIYAACWAHKGNIVALTSVEDVLNYNATIGWPS